MQTEIKNLILTEFHYKFNLWTRYYNTLTTMYEKICNNFEAFTKVFVIRLQNLALNYNTLNSLESVYILCGALQKCVEKIFIYITDVRRYINALHANFNNVAILRKIKPVRDIKFGYDLEHVINTIVAKLK